MKKGLSSILGAVLLFLILSSGVIIIAKQSLVAKREASEYIDSLIKQARSEASSSKTVLKDTREGGFIENVDYNSVQRVIMIEPNGDVKLYSPDNVLASTSEGVMLDPILTNMLSSNATIILDLGERGFLRIGRENIKLAEDRKGSYAGSALVSFVENLLGSDTAYELFFVNNSGITNSVLEKYYLPLNVSVSVSHLKLVIIKTTNGCPQGEKRIARWGAEADYSVLYIINGTVVKNETGHLRYTTASNYYLYQPSYTIDSGVSGLAVQTLLPEKVTADVKTIIRFRIKAPEPFVCTDTWYIYPPKIILEGHLFINITYNGERRPILVVNKNDLHLWNPSSNIILKNHYSSDGNITLYYNDPRNQVLILEDVFSRTTYYRTHIETQQPLVTYLIGELE